MEDNEGIRDEEDLHQESDMRLEDGEELEEVMEEVEETGEIGPTEVSGHPIQTSYRFKLTEILKSLHSPELVIYSEASKDFIYLLKGDSGGEVLREYVHLSPKCSELLEAWKLHLGKPGMSFILSLISAILSHSDGSSQSLAIRSSLDGVARFIIEHKLEDIYAELNSQESRRQSAALSLLASIVRRRIGLASEVAKRFDFKLPILSKLCGVHKKKVGKNFKPSKRLSARRAFVGFAMSFLEVGNPRLLRWILQQRDMYYGVLCELANDDTDTIIFVLSTLLDKLLKEGSLVPPGLRSVLFGSATLEQLSFISGNPLAGLAANIAHDVLVIVCTDPQNGLMPGPGLKGNKKRLLDLMRKLKATEVAHHKQLLLAIVKKEANLCSAYLDEFPYHLEPRPSSSWFSAISLAADVFSTINIGSTIASNLHDEPVANTEDPHEMLKYILPRAFTRSMINKGLLHSDDLVKHGSLRLVLELLKSLDGLLSSLDIMIQRTAVRQEAGLCLESMASMHKFPGLNYFALLEEHLGDGGIVSFPSDEVITQHWVALKHYIQNEVRAELPDPQVLLKLLSSSAKYPDIGVKRPAHCPQIVSKKLKLDEISENNDIFISGLDTPLTNDIGEDSIKVTVAQISEAENDHFSMVYEIWGLPEKTFDDKSKDANSFFQSKLLDVLKIYLRAMPIAFEGSFDFFKILPANPSSLSIYQQRSLLSLLVECIQQSSGNRRSAGALYKHLHSLINFMLYSHVNDIKSQAYTLVRAAMISTGAFDQNLSEIDAWFVFLPGSTNNMNADQSKGVELLYNQSAIVILFLCEAVSTIGNNPYKYHDQMRKHLSEVDVNDHSVCFSPLVFYILQKCLRLLGSDSETLKVHESSMISLYVGNTLSLIMHSQVDMRTLPSLIYMLLYEVFKDHSSADENPRNSLCEWRPLNNLFGFACNILDEQVCILHSVSGYKFEKSENSLSSVLAEVKEFLRQAQGGRVDGLAIAFTSSILCAVHDDILANLPSVLAIMQLCFPSYLPFLSSVFFQEPKLLVSIRELWPKMFFSGLEMISQAVDCSYGGEVGYVFSSNMSVLEANLDSMEFSTFAFCSFLKHSPFYVLLPSILSFATWESQLTRIQEVFPSNRLLELLKVKVSAGSIDESILHLKYVLFWTYHMLLLYKEKQSYIISELLLMCITLVHNIMDHLLAVLFDHTGSKVCCLSSVEQYALVIAELIFCHPIVTLYISNPLYFSRKFTSETFGISLDSFLTTFKQNIHSMDQCMLQLLRKLFEFLLVLSGAINSSETRNSVWESIVRVKNTLIQKILLSFREQFEQFVVSKIAGPFLPIFYVLQFLMDFIPLFDLLELVDWMFCKIESNISGGKSSLEHAVSMGLYVADGSLDKLYNLVQASTSKLKSDIFLEGFKSFDTSLVPKIFYKILDFSLCFHLEQSDACLLKTVNFVYNHRCVKPLTALLPLHVLLSSIIFNIPVKMLMYCIYSTSKTKAKTVLLLTEVSPVHMSLFGKIFLAILDNSLSAAVDVSNAGVMRPCTNKMNSISKDCFSNDEFLLLLPVALSYFISILDKNGEQGIQPFIKIPLTYANILLDGFSTWDVFVSQEIFKEDYDEFSPISLEEFNKFCCSSLIGKAVVMLHYFFIFNGSSIRWKERLKLFDSICPQSSFFDGHFSCIAEGLDACSYKESLKVINEVAAKISFMRLLLFSSECSIQSMAFLEEESAKYMFTEKESGRLNHAKLRFMIILVNTLDHIFKQFPLKVDSSVAGCATHCYGVFRFLEHLILKEIVWLSKEMHNYLIEISSFSFANHFIRSSLLHRYEDHVTLKAIRCILVALSGSKFSFSDVLELLIGHSAFVKIILWNVAISDSSVFASSGTLLQPLNSVLKLVDVACSLQNIRPNEPSSKVMRNCYSVEDAKLELVRLLRILFHLEDRNTRMGCFNSKELLSLLLCGYSATQSLIDLEIFHLMHEIESPEGPDNVRMAALDYMWGIAALKTRKEKTHDVLLPSNTATACETIEERKILFRENIPVDSKVCAITVLHLCNDRSSRILVSLESLIEDASINYQKIAASSGKDIIQPYDPSFILRFSIHSLSMGYLEPVEFSRLGLLAVTFASISSSDEEVRKLGYECLGRFKICLENCRKSKDLLQLLLLMTYLQNGITEAWQEIPSVFAIFAAEASLTLLDHSQNHFLTISKFLMRFPRVNLKAIPLFHTLFESSSIHFRTDRLWILRLLYAGLNSPDDAKLYLRNNVLDVLLTYSSSSLADDEFKILILMIVKKCVRLHMLADHLVKECGLLPWLSSILLFYGKRLIGHQKEQSSADIVKLILEVVNDVVSSSMIIEWLQDCALEQLSEFSLLLLKLFVGAGNFLKEDISLVHAMLIVITSTVRLSQKRNIYQPHFTLSLECLFQLFQEVIVKFGNLGHTIELGMDAILVNTPTPVASHEHKTKLMKLLTWAAPAMLWSNINKKSLTKDLNSALMIMSGKEQIEESIASKLLRWVSAAIILGSVLSNHIEIYASPRISRNENMLSYLKGISMDTREVTKNSSVVNESLAVLILHLQDFHSRKCVLPSIISALCLLLLSTVSSRTGTVKEYLDDKYDTIQSHCSKIRFPTETNPAWRWSFDQPWKDPSLNKSEMELMEEDHACQSLLIIFSNAIGMGKGQGFPAVCVKDVENCGLFEWEKRLFAGF